VNSSNAVFDLKKLKWMNGKYLSSIPLERMLDVLPPYIEDKTWLEDPEFPKRVELMRTRALSLVDLVQILTPFYTVDFPYDAAGFEKFKKDASLPNLLEDFIPVLAGIELWEIHALESQLRSFLEPRGTKAAVLIHPIRLALTGKTVGPGLFEVMELMGKEKTIARLKRFIDALR
jgi:nondiscriminating glutamyl-tRNA synthetase